MISGSNSQNSSSRWYCRIIWINVTTGFKRARLNERQGTRRRGTQLLPDSAMQYPQQHPQMMYPPNMGQIPVYPPQPMAVTPQAQAGSNAPSGQVPVPMTVSDVRSAQASAPAKAVKQGKHIFEFRDCIYKVKTKGGEKTLLHGSMPPALAPCHLLCNFEC
eukprot:2625337-Rhodomonas_salina.1